MKKEKSTAAKFGGLIDIYAIDQAVKDGAVVPLLYEGRHVEQDVNRNGIDLWFERVSRDLTPDQKVDLKRKFARYGEIGQTELTANCVAYDVSEHYASNWKGTGFKAQLATHVSFAQHEQYYDAWFVRWFFSALVWDDFLWGVFTSSFQIEGAAKEDGRGPSIGDCLATRVATGRGSANEPGLAFYDRLIDELWPPASNRGYACIIGICRRLWRILAAG
jgi:hypothetical protein